MYFKTRSLLVKWVFRQGGSRVSLFVILSILTLLRDKTLSQSYFSNYHHRRRRFPLETNIYLSQFFLIPKRKIFALSIFASAVVTRMRVPALPASLGAARTRSQSQVDWRWLTREIPHSDDTAPWRLGTFSNMAHTPQATCASHCTWSAPPLAPSGITSTDLATRGGPGRRHVIV